MTEKQKARKFAKEFVSDELENIIQNWHTRQVEHYGKTPLPENEQELINLEMIKIKRRLRWLLS